MYGWILFWTLKGKRRFKGLSMFRAMGGERRFKGWLVSVQGYGRRRKV